MGNDIFSKIKDELFFIGHSETEDPNVQIKIREDNRKFAIIFSTLQLAYWGICILFSFNDIAFRRCRNVYILAMIVCAIALYISLFPAKKNPRLVLPAFILVEVALLGAGIGIAWFQLLYSARTVVIFTAVLIVPIMFITNTFGTLLLLVITNIIFNIVLKNMIPSETFRWAMSNLIIFSSIGVFIGHFVDKARYERYVYAEDAAKLAELQRKYAYFDQMTGIKNRRSYSEQIDALRKQLPDHFCVVMADINGLKETNDTMGHDAGDELICGAAECLNAAFEGIGEVYRIGGDEFCVLGEATEQDVEERIRRTEKLGSDWKGKEINGISISCGAAFRKDGSDIDSILQDADQKMYDIKNHYYETTRKKRRER